MVVVVVVAVVVVVIVVVFVVVLVVVVVVVVGYAVKKLTGAAVEVEVQAEMLEKIKRCLHDLDVR